MKIRKKYLKKIIKEILEGRLMIGGEDYKDTIPADIAYKSGIEKDDKFSRDYPDIAKKIDVIRKSGGQESMIQARNLSNMLNPDPPSDAEATAVDILDKEAVFEPSGDAYEYGLHQAYAMPIIDSLDDYFEPDQMDIVSPDEIKNALVTGNYKGANARYIQYVFGSYDPNIITDIPYVVLVTLPWTRREDKQTFEEVYRVEIYNDGTIQVNLGAGHLDASFPRSGNSAEDAKEIAEMIYDDMPGQYVSINPFG